MFTHVLILQIEGYKWVRKLICNVAHHYLYGSWLTGVVEVRKRIVFIFVYIVIFLTPMVLLYTVCDVKLPNPGKFPYRGFPKGFLHDLIPSLPYPEIFSYPGNFSYLIKASIFKSSYFSKAVIIRSITYQVSMITCGYYPLLWITRIF